MVSPMAPHCLNLYINERKFWKSWQQSYADDYGVIDMDIFLLWHTHDLTDDYGTHEEVKLIGVFSSEAKAKEIIEQLKDREGFRDFPQSCFQIDKSKMDRPGWVDGFSTVRWTD